MSVDDLLSAPTSLALDGGDFDAEVYLWRDFMPIAPPNGAALAVNVRPVVTPGLVGIERIWVVNGDQVWSVRPSRRKDSNDWVANGGPKWGPGIDVVVVLRVRHRTEGAKLIRFAGTPINATY